jgi:hypothetical protein
MKETEKKQSSHEEEPANYGSFRLGEPATYVRADGTLAIAEPADPAKYRPIQEVARTK